jgi:hypothetical protein
VFLSEFYGMIRVYALKRSGFYLDLVLKVWSDTLTPRCLSANLDAMQDILDHLEESQIEEFIVIPAPEKRYIAAMAA